MLAMRTDLATAFADVSPNSPQYVHLLAEIEKRVFADRADYLNRARQAAASTQSTFTPPSRW
jgi:gamma-glutamyltranspeptidase